MKPLCICTYVMTFLLTFMLIKASVVTDEAFEECSKELIISFPEVLMTEILQKFKVPRDKWVHINKELNEKDDHIIKEFETQLAKIMSDPLSDPKHQRQLALRLFKELLYHVFSETMHKNGITDDQQIHAMLDELQQQKAKKFSTCLERYKSQILGPTPSTQELQEKKEP